LGITLPDLFTSGIIGFLVLITVWILYKEFLLLSFDPQWTEAVGLPARNLHYTMMALVALTVVASMQAVGVALTIALLIIPASTAYLVTNRLTTMMQLASGLGITSSLLGLYISYYQNTASGPSITMVSAVFFVIFAIGRFLWQKFAPPRRQPQFTNETVPLPAMQPTVTRRLTRDAEGNIIIQVDP
jgi:ABC-type Mn2+/Zn2+ transport system permease subunit